MMNLKQEGNLSEHQYSQVTGSDMDTSSKFPCTENLKQLGERNEQIIGHKSNTSHKVIDTGTDQQYLEHLIHNTFQKFLTDLSGIVMRIKYCEKFHEFISQIKADNGLSDRNAQILSAILCKEGQKNLIFISPQKKNLTPKAELLNFVYNHVQITDENIEFLPDNFSGTSLEIKEFIIYLKKKIDLLPEIEFPQIETKIFSSAKTFSAAQYMSRQSLRHRTKLEDNIESSSFKQKLKVLSTAPVFGSGIIDKMKQEEVSGQRDTQNEEQSGNTRGQEDLIMDDNDYPYLKQIQKALIREISENKNSQGFLIGMQGARSAEEIISYLILILIVNPSEGIEPKKKPKIVIIASQNRRNEQIQDFIDDMFIKGALQPSFKLLKQQVTKASKQRHQQSEAHQNFRQEFEDHDVFVMLSGKFQNLLFHREIDISRIDYLIFDEVHAIHQDNPQAIAMHKFYFNSKIMLESEDKFRVKGLPRVIGLFNLENILQLAQNDSKKIIEKLYFLANIFNSSLLGMSKNDLNEIKQSYIREISQKAIQNAQQQQQLNYQVQKILETYGKIQKYLTLRSDQTPLVICPVEKFFKKKILKSFLINVTKSHSILTIDDASYVIEKVGAKVNDIKIQKSLQDQNKQIAVYKPIIETSQFINQHKKRYFSSRLLNDEILKSLLEPEFKINDIKIQMVEGPLQQWHYGDRIFIKKLEAEDYVLFQICQGLCQLGYIDENLRPDDQKIKQKIVGGILEESTMSSSLDASETSTKASTTFSESAKPNPQIKKVEEENKSESKLSKASSIDYMMPRILINELDDRFEFDFSHDFFESSFNQNNRKYQDVKDSQYHVPRMKFNEQQLKVFIKFILNPILRTVDKYHQEYEKKQYKQDLALSDDKIRFDRLFFNMNTEHIKINGIFEDNKQGKQINPNYLKFKNYRQRMFNIHDKNNNPIKQETFFELTKLIDKSIEKFKFPSFLTCHLGLNYYCQQRGYENSIEHYFNRKAFLTLLIIALTEKEPTMIELEKIKQEMGRLAFVGDQAILQAQVMNMILCSEMECNEKDLDYIKNKMVKSEKIKLRAQKVGLQFLQIKQKYLLKTPLNREQEEIQSKRTDEDILKSLAGLFSIYLGFSASYLLLSDLGVIEPLVEDNVVLIGQPSINQKLSILDNLSEKRNLILYNNFEKKTELIKIINKDQKKNIKQWQKIMKERALYFDFVEYENIFNDEEEKDSAYVSDPSDQQLQEFSTANSYKSADSDLKTQSMETNIEKEIIQQVNKSFDSANEEVKSDEQNAHEVMEVVKAINDKNSSIIEILATTTKSTAPSFNSYQQKNPQQEKDIDNTSIESKSTGITEPSEESQQQIMSLYLPGIINLDNRMILLEYIKGYKFKNDYLLLQSIVHKSYSEKLSQSFSQFFNEQSCIEVSDNKFIQQFNLQILEYLGDSIMNFTVTKLFYCETAESKEPWHGDFFSPTKLHQLKTWFTSNNWIGFSLYENYYYTMKQEEQFQQYTKQLFNQIKTKKIDQKEFIKQSSKLPLIYDSNESFQEQLSLYNSECMKQSLLADYEGKNTQIKLLYKKYNSNQDSEQQEQVYDQKLISFLPLSLKYIEDRDVKPSQDDDSVDFTEITEKNVKYQSDVLEALAGAIFLDSGDLELTQMILLKLLNCPSVGNLPIEQHDRTATLQVFNSKPYCKGLKITHTLEEKGDFVYLIGYMKKLEFRRLKYPKDRKRKTQIFYYDVRLYLEDAYQKFENDFLLNRKMDPHNKDEPTDVQWLDFNKNFRKNWKFTANSANNKKFSSIKECGKFIYQKPEHIQIKETQNIPGMRYLIIENLERGLEKINANMNFPLQVLEQERVQSSKIRELLTASGIGYNNCLSYGMKTVKDWVDKLSNRQILSFYEHLVEFGKN